MDLLAAALLLALPRASAPVPRPAVQEGLSPFETATVVLPRDRPPFRRMADLDLDGDVDAIGYHAAIEGTRRHFEVAAYLNDGTGRFTESWSNVQTAAVYGSDYTLVGEIGLLSPDGIPDIAISFRGRRYTFHGRGDGAFLAPTSVGIETIAKTLALADLDGDARSDWVWTAGWHDQDEYLKVSVAFSGGGTPVTRSHRVNGARSLQVHPDDGPDGADVLVIAGATEIEVLYHADGALSGGPYFQHGLSGAMVDTGDVDGDGDVDIVAFQGAPAVYRVLRRTGPGAWTLEPPVAGGPAEFLIDVDGDGDLDGACCGGGSETPVFPDHVEPTDFQIALNTGGVFAPTFVLPGVGSPQLAGVLDVDGDGDRDLVAGRCVVFVDGVVRPERSYAAPWMPSASPRDLCDFDGDGDVDVGLALGRVFENDGTGRFTSVAPGVAHPPWPWAYRGPGFTGDFDGDGDVDLLVEVLGRASAAPVPPGDARAAVLGMALLANDGGGGFGRPARLASAPGVSFAVDALEPEAALLVDPDRDGDLDLVTRNLGPRTLTLRWDNDGTGRFELAGALPARVEWDGDVDLDGDNDLLVARERNIGFELELLLGPGFGRDPRLGVWRFDPFGDSLGHGDLDLDGYPDFAAACGTSGVRAETFRNRFWAGGSLDATPDLDAGFELAPGARIRLADVDGDGRTDALVGRREGEMAELAELHLQEPGGGFVRVLQIVSTGLLVDIDQDGGVDVLGERITFHR